MNWFDMTIWILSNSIRTEQGFPSNQIYVVYECSYSTNSTAIVLRANFTGQCLTKYGAKRLFGFAPDVGRP